MKLRHTILLLACACALMAQAAPPVSKEESVAKQAELKDLRGQLDKLKKELAANENQKAEASDALKDSEQAISEANRVLSDLSEERSLTETELATLNKDIARSRQSIRKSQDKLVALIRNRYKAGQIEAWRLMLNQQDPNRVSRELTYYRYLSQAQLELARTLERQLLELNRLADEIRQKNEILNRIAAEKQRLKKQLLEDQQAKSRILTKLSRDITAQRSQIEKLAEDEKRMTSLVDKLNAMIHQQEVERARQEARKKAEQEKLAQKQARQLAAHNSKSSSRTTATETARVDTARVETLPPTRVNNSLPDETPNTSNFASLKGKLHLPLRGEIVGRFGAQRAEGSSWKGIFIRSAPGQAIKAVANGRVVFADWMRGFGNLIIIDHGGGYLSIYAANESLLKQVGDTIKTGDNIATSGNSGGMGDSGVYFELRQNGKPQDPLGWVGG